MELLNLSHSLISLLKVIGHHGIKKFKIRHQKYWKYDSSYEIEERYEVICSSLNYFECKNLHLDVMEIF